MKRIVLIASLALTCAGGLKAQSYYQDAKTPDILRHNERHERFRKEIILPQVNGYNVYKADLHTHTIHSDGDVIASFRVYEAQYDGLDYATGNLAVCRIQAGLCVEYPFQVIFT